MANIRKSLVFILMINVATPLFSVAEEQQSPLNKLIEKAKSLSQQGRKATNKFFKKVRMDSARYASQVSPLVVAVAACLVTAAIVHQRFSASDSAKQGYSTNPRFAETSPTSSDNISAVQKTSDTKPKEGGDKQQQRRIKVRGNKRSPLAKAFPQGPGELFSVDDITLPLSVDDTALPPE